MGQYSIKELEKLSGIKAHTIRIWEKRYAILNPSRTDTNIRFYGDDDLKKLINLGILNQNGLKISRLSGLSNHELHEKIMSITDAKNQKDVYIDRFIVSMLDLDEIAFSRLIQEATLKIGFENTVVDVLFPFLRKIGILWQTGNITPSHEHFISNLIRQKIFASIDAIPLNDQNPKAIFFLPEGELHEIALLFYTYMAKKNNIYTVYLGQSVPLSDLKGVQETYQADYFISMYSTSASMKGLDQLVSHFAEELPGVNLFLAGINDADTRKSLPDFVYPFNYPSELINLFKLF